MKEEISGDNVQIVYNDFEKGKGQLDILFDAHSATEAENNILESNDHVLCTANNKLDESKYCATNLGTIEELESINIDTNVAMEDESEGCNDVADEYDFFFQASGTKGKKSQRNSDEELGTIFPIEKKRCPVVNAASTQFSDNILSKCVAEKKNESVSLRPSRWKMPRSPQRPSKAPKTKQKLIQSTVRRPVPPNSKKAPEIGKVIERANSKAMETMDRVAMFDYSNQELVSEVPLSNPSVDQVLLEMANDRSSLKLRRTALKAARAKKNRALALLDASETEIQRKESTNPTRENYVLLEVLGNESSNPTFHACKFLYQNAKSILEQSPLQKSSNLIMQCPKLLSKCEMGKYFRLFYPFNVLKVPERGQLLVLPLTFMLEEEPPVPELIYVEL